jgi:hypothetical protein
MILQIVSSKETRLVPWLSFFDGALCAEDVLISCFTLRSSDLLETLDFEDLSGYSRCSA